MKNSAKLCLLLVAVLVGCHDDESPSCQPKSGLLGSWSMIEVNNNFFVEPASYDLGDIVWEFSGQTLSITYDIDTSEFYPLWDFFAQTTMYDLVIEKDTFLVDVSPYFGATEPNLFAMPYVIEDSNSRMVVDFRSPFGDAPWIVFESTCPNPN